MDDTRELRKWLNEGPNRPIDRPALARLLERLEAAERDAERLDWIEANVCDVARLADKRLRISWWNGVGQVFVGEGHHKDWRSAIDAAMKKEPQQ
jgi:hypothetical protein